MISQNKDNQIVTHFPTWGRVLGGFSVAFGIVILAGMTLQGAWDTTNIFGLILATCGAGILLLGGIFLSTYIAEITFDHSNGYITVRRGGKPFPRLTTRISKTDVQSVDISYEDYRWQLSIKTSKKKVVVTTSDEESAGYLARKIDDFARSP